MKFLEKLAPPVGAIAILFTTLSTNEYLYEQYHRWNNKITEMELIYSHLVTSNKPEFLKGVDVIGHDLKIDPNWIMAVMYLESTLKPDAVNPENGASGLIQFTRSTATGLNTSVEAIRLMSNVEQLNLIYRYLRPYKGRMNSFVDVYMAVFFPAAIGKEPDYVLQTKGLSASYIASLNLAYDLNKDVVLTKHEVETAILGKINPEYHPILLKKKD